MPRKIRVSFLSGALSQPGSSPPSILGGPPKVEDALPASSSLPIPPPHDGSYYLPCYGKLMNTFPPRSPNPYTGSDAPLLPPKRNPMTFPLSSLTGAPVLRLYVAPQKSHWILASPPSPPPVSSFGPRTLAFVSGILQLAHDDEKQYVSPPRFTMDTAPFGLVPLSIRADTPVSTTLTTSLSRGSDLMEGIVVWIQLPLFPPLSFLALPPPGSDPLMMDLGLPSLLLLLSPPPPRRRRRGPCPS